MRGVLVALFVVAGLVLPSIGHGDQKDPRLETIFARLQASGDAAEAQALEAMIWQIWTEAGDPATDSLMRLGLGAMQSDNLPGALEIFDAVTLQKPDFAQGWNKRATVLYMLGAYEKSAEDVAKVLALEPRHFGALSGLGLISLQLDRPEEALKAFEKALVVHPHLSAVRANVEALKRRKRNGAI